MFKKNWKSRSAVSPVIATILMVAITVVLAAVLYVMVMGMGGTEGNLPTGDFKTPEKMTDGSYRIQVLSISEAKGVADMRFSVASGATTNVYTIAADGTMATTGDPLATSVSFTDMNGDGKVSTGDFFTVDAPAGTYTAALSYSPASGTSGVICDVSYTVAA